MMKAMAGKQMPEMAIVESNTLAAMGLRQLLESVMPMMKISTFGSFRQYEANNPDHFVHSFVSMHIVLEHRYFFTQGNRNRHVIVLTPSNDPNSQLAEFHCLCVNVPEGYLLKSFSTCSIPVILMANISLPCPLSLRKSSVG